VRRVPAELLLLGAVLLWSFNFTAVRFGVTHGFSPLAYAPLRWGLAGLALAAVARIRGRSLRVGGRDLAILASLSAAGILLSQISFVYALHRSPASTIALIFGTLPIIISLISQASGIDRLRPRHWAACGVSFVGVALISLGAGGASTGMWGALLGLAAVACFAVYSVAIVPVMSRHTPLVVTAVTTLIGAALLAVAAVPALVHQNWDRPEALAWGSLVYSALPAIVLANFLWFTAISRVGPGRASLYPNLQPFLGAIIALLVLSEGIGALEIAGGCVIAAGLLLGRRRPLPTPPAE
jgi:drug/metabolite transporter (DMT)-like permease